MTTETQDENHVSTVRQILLDQMRALRAAGPEEVEQELGRAKGVAELGQVMVNVARVEVDYVKATGQGRAPFFETGSHPALPGPSGTHDVTTLPGAKNGITSVVQHRLKG